MDSRGWADIAYSFLIGDDGTIFEGRGFGVVGGHTAGDNSTSHALCLLGNFQGRRPTAAALDSLVWLAKHGRDRGFWIPTLGGHRDAPGASTACPGNHLYALLPELRSRVNGSSAPEPSSPKPEPKELPEMLIVTNGRGHGLLLSGNVAYTLKSNSDLKAIRDKGVPHSVVSDSQFSLFLKRQVK